ESCRSLRPRIDVGPSKRARKALRRLQTKALRRFRRQLQALDRPRLPGTRIPTNGCRRESVKHPIIRRMNSNQLAFQRGSQLGDFQPMLVHDPEDLVGVRLTFGTKTGIEEAGVGTWQLQPLVSEAGRPCGYCWKRV